MIKAEGQTSGPEIDRLTLVGLVLLIVPLATLGHELLGHGGACTVLGGELVSLGAYYAQCSLDGDLVRRLVAMSGTAMDAASFLLCYSLWRQASSDLARLGWWIALVGKAMVTGGYFLFSGIGGFGDWSPSGHGGLAPLPYPMLIRAVLALVGLGIYLAAIRLANRTLTEMLGGGAAANAVRKTTVMTYYWLNGCFAVAVGLLNPIGIMIVLVSSAAASFGGMAGLFNVATAQPSEPAKPFYIARNWPLIAAGLVVALGFAVIVGPTLTFRQ